MSAFSSIKLNRSISHLKKYSRQEGTGMKLNYNNSFLEKDSGLTKVAYSNGLNKLNSEFKERDSNLSNNVVDEKAKKVAAENKFFKTINDGNKTEKKKMFNIPKVIKKAAKELAKVHAASSNNSGLTKVAHSNGLNNITDKMRERDSNQFHAILDEKLVNDLLQAKMFKKMNDESHENNKQLYNIPKVIKESSKELAKIHAADSSFVEQVHSLKNLTNSFKQRDENLYKNLIKPKEKKFQQETTINTLLARKHDSDDFHGIKNLGKKHIKDMKKPFVSRIVDDTKSIINHFKDNDKKINDVVVKPKENKFQKSVQYSNNLDKKHDAKIVKLLRK